MITIEQIAKVCHQTNKAYCEQLGDTTQLDWDKVPEWQRVSAIKGVEYKLNNPDAKPSDSHNSWLEEKRNTGWTYGPIKDPEKKQHPCFIPYEGLPLEQQVKDFLFIAVVNNLKPLLK